MTKVRNYSTKRLTTMLDEFEFGDLDLDPMTVATIQEELEQRASEKHYKELERAHEPWCQYGIADETGRVHSCDC